MQHARDPGAETAAAQRVGLEVVERRTARWRMEFFDIGAVVWLLRKCVWWVSDFTVAGDGDRLRALDAQIRADGAFIAPLHPAPDPGLSPLTDRFNCHD